MSSCHFCFLYILKSDDKCSKMPPYYRNINIIINYYNLSLIFFRVFSQRKKQLKSKLNNNLKIISRATEETTMKKLKLAGANNVIMPDKIGGDHMASLVVTPDLIEFLDNLSVSGEDDSMNVEQVSFSKVCPDGKELAIHELDLRKKTGCSIIGYRTPNGEYIVNPEADLILQQGSKLILIGRPFQIDSLKQLYNV